MADFCFASYTKTLKIGLVGFSSDEELIRTLFNCLINELDLKGKNGEPIDVSKTLVSDYLARRRPVPKKIKDASVHPAVCQNAEQYFQTFFIPCINPHNLDDLLDAIAKLIENDTGLTKKVRKQFEELRTTATPAKYLSDTFLFSLVRPNRVSNKKSPSPKTTATGIEKSDIEIINEKLAKFGRLERIIPPTEITVEELPYVTALLAAYADDTGEVLLSHDDLQNNPRLKKYLKNFKKQRNYFYAAETVRQGSRDSLGEEGPKHFEDLKSDTLTFIDNVYEDDYDSGYDRLKAVTDRAAEMSSSRSILLSIPTWVGPDEKMGICHFLVNDGSLKWVDEDE